MLSDRDYTRSGYRPPPLPRQQQGSVLKYLIYLNGAVFILQLLLDHSRFAGGLEGGFTSRIALDWDTLRQGQLWRLGTHMFAHGGFFHLLFNMWSLYIFGQPLEERIGGRRLLNAYLISGLVGAGTWLLLNSRPAGYVHGVAVYPSVIGASGAVFGIMMSSAIMFPNRLYMMLIPPIPMRLKTLAFVFGIIEVVSLLNERSSIAHLAHLGGMLGGYFYMRLLFRSNWGSASHLSPRRWFGGSRAFRPREDTRSAEAKPHEQADDEVMGQVDDILDKIGRHGVGSLSARERQVLDEARERLKRRR
ncbi:MAG: Rhomboid protease GluP [Lentisphaerae bacterium ADurb.BinA184]|nr:MAG: Rhomboid protease GluP [Lentisphaerae bacterium ADurb.BinA184]